MTTPGKASIFALLRRSDFAFNKALDNTVKFITNLVNLTIFDKEIFGSV